jgi:membrane-bound lytic murein transglycosylase MltF
MQKSVWIILSLLILTIAFQGNASSTENKPFPLNAHISETYHDDLPGLLQKKYIRVLTTVNRTNFFVSDGHLVGYEYSLLKKYEKFLNKQINRKDLQVVLDFIPVARDELIPKLVNGYGDIAAAGLTITAERKKKVSFTKPYLTGIKEVVVTSKGGFYPQNCNDLSGRKVYVRKSSSYYQSLIDLNERFLKENKRPAQIINLSEEIETESILEMINSGAIGITVADSHVAKVWSQVLKNIEIHENVTLRSGSLLAWMVRKNNPQLLASLNEFLKTHKRGTLLGNIYFKRYYQNANKLKNPIEIEAWQKLKQHKEVIKRYAAKYDFDWLLILGMAFQESGLDHTRKSKAGAVGIMQILPSTARDKKVGIKNVDKLENNIHAGVKYLDFLRDNYFSNEEIRPRDQVRMSLAAYNAGPAKIRKVRKLAEKMGLNKNRWFRNVELAALRIIGQETVRYVSNINKYYVLYQTLLEKEKKGGVKNKEVAH